MKNIIFTVFGVMVFSSGVLSQPTPTPAPRPVPKIVSAGVVNGKAINLVRPSYPAAAKAVRASGMVNIQVTIDESGNVISASAVSGHILLRKAAEEAARQSKFSQTTLSGQPVKVTGVLVYNFIDNLPPAPPAEKMDYEKTRYILLGLFLETLSRVDYEPEIKKRLDEFLAADSAYNSFQRVDLKQYESLSPAGRNGTYSKMSGEIKPKLKDFDLWQYQVGENTGALFVQLRNLAETNSAINESELRKNLDQLRGLIKSAPPEVPKAFITVLEYHFSELDNSRLVSREGKRNIIDLVEMILKECRLVE